MAALRAMLSITRAGASDEIGHTSLQLMADRCPRSFVKRDRFIGKPNAGDNGWLEVAL